MASWTRTQTSATGQTNGKKRERPVGPEGPTGRSPTTRPKLDADDLAVQVLATDRRAREVDARRDRAAVRVRPVPRDAHRARGRRAVEHRAHEPARHRVELD